MWSKTAASFAQLKRDDGWARQSRIKLAMVYADSLHIHLQQSVANQSKVKDNRSEEEYSKSTEQWGNVLNGCFADHKHDRSTSYTSHFFMVYFVQWIKIFLVKKQIPQHKTILRPKKLLYVKIVWFDPPQFWNYCTRIQKEYKINTSK